MRVGRSVAAVALASMLAAQVPVVAHAENPMGYRLLSVEQASRLPNNRGTVGLDVAPARQITDSGMTFDLLRVQRVQTGSPAAQAGFQRGDQIIAVNGRVFPTLAAFAAYMKSMAPGTRANIDYIPARGGPKNAERVAILVGKPGANGEQYAQAQEKSGMSTRTKIGIGAAAVLGCYYLGCFSGGSGSSSR
jgi:C-terminal processing protease CtpA/Prc